MPGSKAGRRRESLRKRQVAHKVEPTSVLQHRLWRKPVVVLMMDVSQGSHVLTTALSDLARSTPMFETSASSVNSGMLVFANIGIYAWPPITSSWLQNIIHLISAWPLTVSDRSDIAHCLALKTASGPSVRSAYVYLPAKADASAHLIVKAIVQLSPRSGPGDGFESLSLTEVCQRFSIIIYVL